MLDEVTAVVDGYNAYFSFSKVKTGYSGESILLSCETLFFKLCKR